VLEEYFRLLEHPVVVNRPPIGSRRDGEAGMELFSELSSSSREKDRVTIGPQDVGREASSGYGEAVALSPARESPPGGVDELARMLDHSLDEGRNRSRRGQADEMTGVTQRLLC